MTLHEAIEKVLKENGKPLKPAEIATILNDLKIYQKGDKSRIKSSQISARVNNYPSYFFKDNGLVYLNNWDKVKKEKTSITPEKKEPRKVSAESLNVNLKGNPSEIDFLTKNEFEMIGLLSDLLKNGLPNNENLNRCGIYAISIPNDYFPEYYSPNEAKIRGNVIKPWTVEKLKNKWVKNTDIVYYGLAGKKSFRSLNVRLGDLLRHGNGKISTSGPHKGGEILWQLKNYERFALWILSTGEPPEPRNYEELVLRTFHNEKQKLPFANRQF
ncbi:MAG: winged helix-turn-helix domain-containing protein [Candidatus Thermoplasmatota archaeon]|nr:winged helix-turn-helix domain-containing protein [Candidatus Thermoplasmatota archaeon]MBN2747163.1 winged helix-turn-helix domain-containing protein [Bacteroidales bacterium]